MTEQLLQFIWQYQHFNQAELKTSAGDSLQILYPGMHNSNQGPDFLNAKIICAGTTLAGSIEIHLRASEWLQHGHSADRNYNNVVLHVVLEEDKNLGLHFPTLELGHRISNLLLSKYSLLMTTQKFVPCADHLKNLNDLMLVAWKDRLLAERLQEKAAYIHLILAQNNFHWEETFWQMLAGNFGMKINREAFERVAAALPLATIARHRPQVIQLEALLLGTAGLLQHKHTDSYAAMLTKEFTFLQKKYGLPELNLPVHFLRMRPANFPTVRLAQLAMLLSQTENLFSAMKNATTLTSAIKVFDVTANDYWHYHYLFDESTAFKKKRLGAQMAQHIMLNTVLPMLYAYGRYNNSEIYKLKALAWLNELKAEQNTIVAGFAAYGMAIRSAGDSQALIQLKNNYCNEKRCLHCAIGNSILKG